MNSIEQWNADSATAAGVVFQGDQHLHRAFRSYVLGLLSAALRHHEGARRFAVDVERMASVHELAGALAHGVRARLAWEEGRPEAALDELQRARRSQAAADMLGIVPFYSLPQERFLRGEVLRKLERYEEAHGWYSAFDEHSPFGRVYLAPAHFRSAEVDEKLGRREEAASHYARFVELWSEADEELRPFVEEARRRLSRLRAEPR
jgi:tetratricopeptide (TPR) repeat protein